MVIVLSVIFFFMIIRFVVSLFNFLSDPKLRRVAKHYHDKVSILIPARNEQFNILTLLNAIHQQDYADYEVIVIDDNSTDDTYALCKQFSASHPKFSVIKGGELPSGWLGKNFACHQLTKKAGGNFLLFLDADETIEAGLINSALHRMHQKNLALLSLLPNQAMPTIGEQAVMPLMHYILLNLLPLQLVYLIKNSSRIAAASGQFMLFNAAPYRQGQWHRAVKNKVVEDIEIMRLVKTGGYNAEVLLANKMLYARNFKGYIEAVNGTGKNLLAAFNYNIISLLVYLSILLGGPLLIIATLNVNLIEFMCGLIILTRITISLSAQQSAWKNILLHPIQMFSLMVITFLAVQRYLTKTVVWKGRQV